MALFASPVDSVLKVARCIAGDAGITLQPQVSWGICLTSHTVESIGRASLTSSRTVVTDGGRINIDSCSVARSTEIIVGRLVVRGIASLALCAGSAGSTARRACSAGVAYKKRV